MIRFIKSQASAFAATITDYVVTFLLVEVAELGLPLSNVMGNVTGAVINFLATSHWAFREQVHSGPRQLGKYILVWCGYLLLNTLLVTWITSWWDTHYLITKMMVGIFLSITYNFTLQKNFIFK
jgi:putative flippase GtrA